MNRHAFAARISNHWLVRAAFRCSRPRARPLGQGASPAIAAIGVACLPVAVLGLSTVLARMVRAEVDGTHETSGFTAVMEG